MIGFLMRKVFFRNLTLELTEIKLAKNGLSIREPFLKKPKLYSWSEIKDVRFSESYKDVILETRENNVLLKNYNIGWYEFIQNVPSQYSNFDFNYVKILIDSLKPCGVCGIVAVSDEECIVCKNISWNDEMPENRIAYYKSKQKELFSNKIKSGIKIKKDATSEHGFKADINWELYI